MSKYNAYLLLAIVSGAVIVYQGSTRQASVLANAVCVALGVLYIGYATGGSTTRTVDVWIQWRYGHTDFMAAADVLVCASVIMAVITLATTAHTAAQPFWSLFPLVRSPRPTDHSVLISLRSFIPHSSIPVDTVLHSPIDGARCRVRQKREHTTENSAAHRHGTPYRRLDG
jgi:hypothetical protein